MLHFFYGDNNLIDLALQNKKEEFRKNNYQIHFFDFANKEEEVFLNQLSMNSMFAKNKAFFLKRVESIKTAPLQKLLKSIALFDLSEKEIFISFAEKEIGKNIQKELEKISAEILLFASEKQESSLQEYLEKKLAISSYESQKLLEMLGKDFHKLEQESNKILQLLDGEKFSFEKVMPILSIEKDYNIFSLIDQFLEEESGIELLTYLEQNPNDISLFLYQLTETLLLITKVSSMLESEEIPMNITYPNFKKSYEHLQIYFRGRGDKILHPYPVYLKIKIAKKYPSDFWLLKIEEALVSEYSFKSGFIDASTAISTLILGFYSSSSNTLQNKRKEYHKGPLII